MKHFILSLIILFSAATFAAPHQPEKPQTKKAETKVETQTAVQGQDKNSTDETYVYVCTGQYAYSYHSHYCSGLNACKADVIKVTKEKAVNEMHRTPCGNCYK